MTHPSWSTLTETLRNKKVLWAFILILLIIPLAYLGLLQAKNQKDSRVAQPGSRPSSTALLPTAHSVSSSSDPLPASPSSNQPGLSAASPIPNFKALLSPTPAATPTPAPNPTPTILPSQKASPGSAAAVAQAASTNQTTYRGSVSTAVKTGIGQEKEWYLLDFAVTAGQSNSLSGSLHYYRYNSSGQKESTLVASGGQNTVQQLAPLKLHYQLPVTNATGLPSSQQGASLIVIDLEHLPNQNRYLFTLSAQNNQGQTLWTRQVGPNTPAEQGADVVIRQTSL